MERFLNRLVLLCAGKIALQRLENLQLLTKAQAISDKHLSKYAYLHGRQLSIETSRSPSPAPSESIVVDQPRPISIHMSRQQDRARQRFLSSRTRARQDHVSLPSSVESDLDIFAFSYSPAHKLLRNHRRSAMREIAIDDIEVGSYETGIDIVMTETDSDHYDTRSTVDLTDTGASDDGSCITSTSFDVFEEDMRILSMQMLRTERYEDEILLGGNRYLATAKAGAANSSHEDLEHAARSLSFRVEYGYRHRFPETDNFDVYGRSYASSSGGWHGSW